MPLKLFVESRQRQSKRAETMLKDAGKRFDTIDVGASFLWTPGFGERSRGVLYSISLC